MAQFLNSEVNPTEKASAKGVELAPQELVQWDNATDKGINAIERAGIMAQAQTPATSAGESFAAGMGNSIIAAAVRKAQAPQFIQDPNFDAAAVITQDPTIRLYKPNGEEAEYLREAVSPEDLAYRTEQMLEQRERDQKVSENLVTGIAGSIVGDAPTLLAPQAAAGVAGRAGLAIRTAIRAADVGSAVYASDQLGQSQGVAAVVAGLAGLDQLFDVKRAFNAATRATKTADAADAAVDAAPAQAARKDTVEFDMDAPTKRSGPDSILTGYSGQKSLEEVRAAPLRAPIKVAKGQQSKVQIDGGVLIQHLRTSPHIGDVQKQILDSLENVVSKIDVQLTGNTNLRSRYWFSNGGELEGIELRASASAKGKTWNTVGDALDALDADTAKIAVHELIHAATSKTLHLSTTAEAKAARETLEYVRASIADSGKLPESLKYRITDVDEMLAGLADSPEWVEFLANTRVGTHTLLQQIGAAIMRALGFSGDDTALAAVVGAYEDIIKEAVKDAGTMRFYSESMDALNSGVQVRMSPAAQAQKMLDNAKTTFKNNFALYDNIAQGNKELADILVSDAAAVGARKPSVVDYKRNLTLEMDAAASVVEDAIVSALGQRGVGFMDRFFQRPRFVQARRELEDKLAKYLDYAYDAESNGRAVPVPDPDIAPVVAAYKKSGWAGRWHDHIEASGLVEPGKVVRSDYYFPRQYSYDKMRQLMQQGRTMEDFRNLFRQALRDLYPTMQAETVQRVAREMADGIYNGRTAQGPMWKQLVNGLSQDDLVMAMKQAGIDDAEIDAFIKGNVKESGATSPARNLRQRNRFNMTKEYTVNGQVMRLADIMDTDVSKVMHGYTNRMSGRVGFAYAGIQDLAQLEKMINDGKHTLPDPGKWENAVNDTIDFILGGVAGGANNQLPEILRAAGNLANATMLKNSALYQITDTALAMKEFGMKRVLRSMVEQPWWKEGQVAVQNPDMAKRLDSILRGSIQKEMRFRWLNTYADDNLDLTRSSHWFNVSQNFGQAARHANGMSMVHRMQVNINSGMVMDEIKMMLDGDSEAFKRLERWGLSREVADRAIAANARNPGQMLPADLQMQIETVGTRMMDYVVQQVRTGETSHFAQFSPVGKVIVGYQSFALAATNKIFRRELNDAGILGLAHIMAYQFPMMLLVTQAKYAMDGKTGEKDISRLAAEAALGMSMLGGISMLQQLFVGETPRHSLASLGYVTSILGTLQGVASGNVDAQQLSRVLPLVQEFAPTRIIINNFGDD